MSYNRARSKTTPNQVPNQKIIVQAISRISEFNPGIKITLGKLMTYFEEVHKVRNTPANRFALKRTLSGMATRGVLIETKSIGEHETNFSLTNRRDLHPDLSVTGHAVDRTRIWPSGNSLPGATSLLCRPVRNVPVFSPRSAPSHMQQYQQYQQHQQQQRPQHLQQPLLLEKDHYHYQRQLQDQPQHKSETPFSQSEVSFNNQMPSMAPQYPVYTPNGRKPDFTKSFARRAGSLLPRSKTYPENRPNTPEDEVGPSTADPDQQLYPMQNQQHKPYDKYFSNAPIVPIAPKCNGEIRKPPPSPVQSSWAQKLPYDDKLNFDYGSSIDNGMNKLDLTHLKDNLRDPMKAKETFENFDKFLKTIVPVSEHRTWSNIEHVSHKGNGFGDGDCKQQMRNTGQRQESSEHKQIREYFSSMSLLN